MCNFIYGIIVTLCFGAILEMFRQGYVSLVTLLIIVVATAVATSAIQSLKIIKRSLSNDRKY